MDDNFTAISKQDIILSELCSFRYTVLNELKCLKNMLKKGHQNCSYFCKYHCESKMVDANSNKSVDICKISNSGTVEEAVNTSSLQGYNDVKGKSCIESLPKFTEFQTLNEENTAFLVQEKIDSPTISFASEHYDVNEHSETVCFQDFAKGLSDEKKVHQNIAVDELASKLNVSSNESFVQTGCQLGNFETDEDFYDVPDITSSFNNDVQNISNQTIEFEGQLHNAQMDNSDVNERACGVPKTGSCVDNVCNSSNRTLKFCSQYDKMFPLQVKDNETFISRKIQEKSSKHLKSQENSTSFPKSKNNVKLLPKAKSRRKRRSSYQCNKCKVLFASKKILDQHVLTQCSHTSALKSKQLESSRCFLCQKTFSCKTSMKRHVALHMKLFKCSVCEKPFSSNWALKMHAQVHTGKRPYQCAICFKTYSSKWYLVQHSRKYHFDEKLN